MNMRISFAVSAEGVNNSNTANTASKAFKKVVFHDGASGLLKHSEGGDFAFTIATKKNDAIPEEL